MMLKRILTLGLLCSTQALAQYQGTAPALMTHNSEAPDAMLLDKLLAMGPQERRIQMDDVIAVEVYGVKDYSLKQRVPLTGNLTLPLIGQVQVLGLNSTDAASKIQQALAKSGMIMQAQVDVTFVSQPSATVTISGEVHKPGVFPAFGDKTLESYLALAEGLKDTASATVKLIRPGYPEPILIPLSSDTHGMNYSKIRLFQGDQVICGKVGVFYVVGAVKTQNAYALKNSTPTSVFQALALSGGIGYEADLTNAQVIRNGPNGRLVIPVNLGKVRVNRESDIYLQPDDILYIPTSQLKAAIKSGGAAVVLSLATSLVYATHN